MNNTSTFSNFKKYFQSLTTLQQAGTFLWPSLQGTTLTNLESECLKEIKPSGLIFFKRNFENGEQSTNLIQQCRSLLDNKNSEFTRPLITCIDEEGGRVTRLPFANISGKSALQYANNLDIAGLKQQVEKQCQYSKQIGINCLLAPVADILTEQSNTVLGDRCFGRDAFTVSEFSSLVHNQITNENLFSCAKHFPGHGNTTTDSHKELSTSNVTLEVLRTREWIPFQRLIAEKIPMIMSAHVLLPEIDAKFPATLSKTLLKTYLRDELGFKGLILSDDLRMNAIALHYNVTKQQDSSVTTDLNSINYNDDYLKQASVDALIAGCDILLSCQSIEKEKVIAQSIADKLTNDLEFQDYMCEKAWHIYKLLNKIV